MTLTQRLVGIVFVLIGFGCFVLAPVVTARCERRDERVACEVRVKALGLVPLQQIDVRDLQAARVEAQQTTERSPNGGHDYIDTNWAAVLVGTDGEHRSRFLVSRDRSEIEPLIDAIHRVLAGDDAAAHARFGPAAPGVIFGSLFVPFGLLLQLSSWPRWLTPPRRLVARVAAGAGTARDADRPRPARATPLVILIVAWPTIALGIGSALWGIADLRYGQLLQDPARLQRIPAEECEAGVCLGGVLLTHLREIGAIESVFGAFLVASGAGLVRMRRWASKAVQIGLAIAIAYVAFGFVFNGAIGYVVYWTDLLLAGGPWKPPGALDLLAWSKRIAPRSDPLVAILPLGAGIVALRRFARTRNS